MGVEHWHDTDSSDEDEYAKFVQRMNPPRVVVDNESSSNATVVKVDSANKYGILLEVVQVLIDLNLIISKAYITQDEGWFMDVFNVTDRDGNKLSDETTIFKIADIIRKSLGADSSYRPSKRRSVDVATSTDCTVIELTGNDRPGLLSEISAVLAHLNCNLVNIEMWTHNTRVVSVIHVKDQLTNSPVTNTKTITQIEQRLNYVLKGDNVLRGAKTNVLPRAKNNTQRRLHELMSGDGDLEQVDGQDFARGDQRPIVTVNNWNDKDYSVVTIKCKDRSKLLFDTVYTLIDMKFVIFHANVESQGTEAYQEFYIRHMDGSRVKDEERDRVIHCLEAALQRRVSEGVKLELVSGDKVGLLSEVTRIFREHSLTVTKAECFTREEKAIGVFYMKHNDGNLVEPRTIDEIRKALKQSVIHVKGPINHQNNSNVNNGTQNRSTPIKFLFGELFKAMSIYNFGFVA